MEKYIGAELDLLSIVDADIMTVSIEVVPGENELPVDRQDSL